MKKLTASIRVVCDTSPSESRQIAAHMVRFLEAKVHAGEEIDLGFLKIYPVRVKPVEIKFNLRPDSRHQVFLGEGTKWKVRIMKSWLRRFKPFWSKY